MNIQDQPKGSRERTLDEVKAEFMRRAGKLNPFEDIKREDAERVMAALKNLDKDHWAEEWSKIGHGYEAKGDAAAKAGASGKELAEIYMHAFDACRVGRYPSPTSPGKLKAYQHSLRMFRKAAKHFDPPLEIIEMPFEGKKLVGYLQKPPGVAKPPVVMHWGGVDGWKEDRLKIAKDRDGCRPRLAHHRHAGHRRKPGAVRRSRRRAHVSSPGSIICRPAPTSTASRVAVWGGSFGAYWAARLAFTAADRIKGAVFHGGNVHYGFQREWLVPAFTTGGATYLFGAAEPARRARPRDGREDDRGIPRALRPLSLKTMGLLDKKSAPLLGVNGKLDDQAPIADVYLLMEHGNPKSARVYPEGHHMGRTPGQHPDEIANTIVGWLKERLAR